MINFTKDSVYYLVNELCERTLHDYNPHEVPDVAAVRKLKSKAYETLLKKSLTPASVNNDIYDPIRELDVRKFEMKLSSGNDVNKIANCTALESILNSVNEEPYFQSNVGNAILTFILSINNVNCTENQIITQESNLLVPGPFTLFANFAKNCYYPPVGYRDTLLAVSFRNFKTLNDYSNPYLPRFIFRTEPKRLCQIESQYSISSQSTVGSINNALTYTWQSSLKVNPSFCRFFNQPAITSPNEGSKTLTSSKPSSSTVIHKSVKRRDNPNKLRKIFSWNWECLGQYICAAKPFVSEVHEPLHLYGVLAQAKGDEFDAKIVSIERFVEDLKSLTIGIQSDSFMHNETLVFSMVSNLTVQGISPYVMENFIKDFIECGTCFKRLQIMVTRKNSKQIFDGFIFKALCKTIEDYLVKFRQFVVLYHDTTPLQYYKRMKKMMQQLTSLSLILAIHPGVDDSIRPPMGSQFLGYLYKEITHATQQDLVMLLVYVLKRCCHVYFKHLQKWLFYGILDDPCNELFICFVDHYRPNTKYYFDKAYFVRKEFVPGFFQGFEDQILQCGKYAMLLKAFNPNHPLLSIDYPSISVCLSFEEVETMENICKKYLERTEAVCGKPIYVRDMYEKQDEEKRNFIAMVSEKSKRNIEQWTIEKDLLKLEKAEKKRMRLNELQEQLQEFRNRKIEEKKTDMELDLKILKEGQRIEDKRLIQENINTQRRIDYYKELNTMIEEKKKRAIEELAAIKAEQASIAPSADFESCEESEGDAKSLYEDALQSNEFLNTLDNNLIISTFLQSEKVPDKRQLINDDNSKMKRSTSDYFNSNDVMNEYHKNKIKIMGSSTISDCFGDKSVIIKQPERTSPLVLTETTANDMNSNQASSDIIESLPTIKRTLTDLEINRKKMMQIDNFSEDMNYNQASDESIENVPTIKRTLTDLEMNRQKMMQNDNFSTYSTANDMNCNQGSSESSESIPTFKRTLTDLEINRQKMMQNDNFSEYSTAKDKNCNQGSSDSFESIPTIKRTLTDLEINRQKMMQNDTFAEYNKIPERKNLHLELNSERSRNRKKVLESEYNILTGISTSVGTTPMSTTSDPPMLDEKMEDLKNANIELKIDIKAALISNIKTPQQLDVPTAIVEETPEYALNTAGILAKDGFVFQTTNRNNDSDVEHMFELNSTYDNPILKRTSPYSRCQELLESNFKCKPLTSFLHLNKSIKTDDDYINKLESIKDKKLGHLNVITLTEFLQKSVIVPLSAHLEVLNNEIMRIFLQDLDILSHFKSLRNYFFLMDGEFGSFICDELISKLEGGAQPNELLNYQMLHTILDHALGSSIIGNDKNSDNISFIVSDMPEKFDLTSPSVLSNLSLSYRVDWPVNLILNPETIEQYSNIFKYLIKVRRISWVLEESYQNMKEIVKKHGKDILRSPQYRRVQQMRHKFYHFVHALKNHITSSALQASWKTYEDDLMSAQSMEDIYRKHANYIKRVLFLCMLNKRSSEFYNAIENLFKVSLRFYRNLKSREWKRKSGEEFYTHSRYDRLVVDEIEFEKFIKYTIYLGNKIVRHGYQEEIGEFINLINFNHYYATDV